MYKQIISFLIICLLLGGCTAMQNNLGEDKDPLDGVMIKKDFKF